MARVFKSNMGLQSRINEIHIKGTGNFPLPKAEKSRNRASSVLNRTFIGSNEMSLIANHN